MRFTINVITQEGLYQNKVNSSLVSTYNCKMDYCPESAKSKRGKRQIVSRQLLKVGYKSARNNAWRYAATKLEIFHYYLGNLLDRLL